MRTVVAALLLAVIAPPSTALGQEAGSSAEEDSEGVRLLREFDDHFTRGRYAEALAVIERAGPTPDNDLRTAILSALKASALLGMKREKEADALIADIERLAPNDPAPVSVLFAGGLVTDRLDVAGGALDKMIARFPDRVREIDEELMQFFLRRQRETKDPRRDDRRIALGQLGYGGADGDFLTADAIALLLKRGDELGATELVRFLDNPRLVENLLIQRKYAVLWPALEETVGNGLTNVRQTSVVAAQNEQGASPTDEKVRRLAYTLRLAGRHEEAIALKSHLPDTPDGWSKISERAGWIVNELALALHEMGRAEEADRLFATLNDAAMDHGRWRVSMKINRLELLVGDSKYQQALSLLPLTEESAAKDGNAYSQQLVRRLKYCTLVGLDQKAEAAALLPDLLKHAEDTRLATIDGLICAGDLAKAEEIAIAALEDDDFQESFVRALQSRPLTGDDPSIWSKGWQQLRSRPAIAKAFDRLGRDLPERFLPPSRN